MAKKKEIPDFILNQGSDTQDAKPKQDSEPEQEPEPKQDSEPEQEPEPEQDSEPEQESAPKTKPETRGRKKKSVPLVERFPEMLKLLRSFLNECPALLPYKLYVLQDRQESYKYYVVSQKGHSYDYWATLNSRKGYQTVHKTRLNVELLRNDKLRVFFKA